MSSLQTALNTFIEHEQLPDSYRQTVKRWFIPLAEDILRQVSVHEGSFVLGVNGSQGSGKSTLAALLVILFKEMLGLSSINLSLDDFYLTRSERQRLARDVHPLLVTRGVPGTHDTGLALQTIAALKTRAQVPIPRFDKAQDERFDPAQWPSVIAPVDVIVLEGWCLGIEPQRPEELIEPVNALEAEEDAGARWRTYVNERLTQEYRHLFAELDMLLMLKAPGFEQVIDWRLRQEQKLAARTEGDSSRLMSRDALERFIAHYERLTCHALATLPEKADVVFQLNEQQGIESRLKV